MKRVAVGKVTGRMKKIFRLHIENQALKRGDTDELAGHIIHNEFSGSALFVLFTALLFGLIAAGGGLALLFV